MSQKQRTVALSSCEAKYMALTLASCQSVWLSNLIGEMLNRDCKPVKIYVDNKSAIELAKNPVFHGRSKHIKVKFHYVRICLEEKEIVIDHIPTVKQRSDFLTKSLGRVKFQEMRDMAGICDVGDLLRV